MDPIKELEEIRKQIAMLQQKAEEAKKKIEESKKEQCQALCKCIEQIENLSTANWLVVVNEQGDVEIYPRSSAYTRSVESSGALSERFAAEGTKTRKLIEEVKANPDVSISEIAARLQMSPGHAYQAIREAKKRGLLPPD